MISRESFITNPSVIMMDENNVVVAPHRLLRPFIANYTFTTPQTMTEQLAVLPTASCTLVCAIGNNDIINRLRGVNTKQVIIGSYARQFDFLFLVEFHPGGFYPFIRADQNLLTDNSFPFEELSKDLNRQITEAYFMSSNLGILKCNLDKIFLSRLDNDTTNSTFDYALKKIIKSKGITRIKELTEDVYYSDKQLNRLFQKHIGTGVKTFSRIVRMKYAVDLLNNPRCISDLIEITGHYDYPHFIHDFKKLYGITPKEYMSKTSLFYNDLFKL